MEENILVIAAHPDDDVLGMGGLMARAASAGRTVQVLYLGDGVSSRSGAPSQAAELRREAARRACARLGAQILAFGDFPDNRFDTVPLLELARFIEEKTAAIDLDEIYTHHQGDLNIDHERTARAVLTAFRPQPGARWTTISAFEVPSSTEWAGSRGSQPFLPDTWTNITDHLETKLEAWSCYQEELRPDPHTRSLEGVRHLAMRRGREVGFHAAEAFATLWRRME